MRGENRNVPYIFLPVFLLGALSGLRVVHENKTILFLPVMRNKKQFIGHFSDTLSSLTPNNKKIKGSLTLMQFYILHSSIYCSANSPKLK
jgi:hypothetical protein